MPETGQNSSEPVTRFVSDDFTLTFAEAEEKGDRFIKDHKDSFLNDERYRGQNFLLSILYLENFSEDFIGRFFSGPSLTTVTADVLHSMALVSSEEIAQRFYGREFTCSDVNDALLQYFAAKRFPEEVALREELTKEVDDIRSRYETEIGFLKKERKRMKKQIRESGKKQAELDEARKEVAENEVKLAAAEKDKEIQKLTMELEACRKERDEAVKAREDALKEMEDVKASTVENRQAEAPGNDFSGNSRSSFIGPFRSRKNLKRAEVLVNSISDKKHSTEQFDVIADAYQKGMSYKNLVKLADAQIPVENLQILENLLLRNEYGSHSGREQ